MLIQLGDIWVDPLKVISMTSIAGEMISITTTEGVLDAKGDAYLFASQINEAVATQSFGGEVNEKESIPK